MGKASSFIDECHGSSLSAVYMCDADAFLAAGVEAERQQHHQLRCGLGLTVLRENHTGAATIPSLVAVGIQA